MFKILRKYNKIILAVGGTLLLVTFLIPFAFDGLGQVVATRGTAWAYVGPDGRKVTMKDHGELLQELALVQVWGPLQPGLGPVDDAAHWYLLTLEAEEAGLVGAIDPAHLDQQDLQRVTIAQMSGMPTDLALRTLAKWNGARRLLDLYLDGDRYSDYRLRQEARRAFHTASVQLAVLVAPESGPPMSFSDEALSEQMKKYAEVARGEGEMGFGYKLPDRAKIEWLDVGVAGVRSMLESSPEMDEVALRKHWRTNSTRLGEPRADQPVPASVRDDRLEELVTRTLAEIAKYGYDQLRFAQRALQSRDGYLVVPEGWQGVGLEGLALRIQEKFGVPLPSYQSSGDRWLDADGLAALPGIGAATTDKFGAAPLALSELVAAAREFGVNPAIPVQQGIAGPPLTGSDGSVCFFRITATDPSRVPTSLDEVRDQVAADLNRLARYRELVARSDAIRQEAIDDGLVAVAVGHGTKVETARATLTDLTSLLAAYRLGLAPKASPAPLPGGIGADEHATAAIIDAAMSLPELPMRDIPIEQRTLVVPVDDKLSLLVVEITDNSPMTTETFGTYAALGVIQLPLLGQDASDQDARAKVFGIEELASRHNFSFANDAPLVPEKDGATGPLASDSG